MTLNTEIARKLCALTSAFYEVHADSFSATRRAPWAGWRRCLDAAREAGIAGEGPRALSVLDLACGNLRFEDFLARELPATDLAFHAVDSCDGLVASAARAFGLDVAADRACACGRAMRPTEPADASLADTGPGAPAFARTRVLDGGRAAGAEGPGDDSGGGGRVGSGPASTAPRRIGLAYQHLDVTEALFAGDLAGRLDAPPCDMAVSFGFLHHVPLVEQREDLLRALTERTRSGGLVVVSFWRFLNSEELAVKARETDGRARAELGLPALDAGDFLLGWRGEPGAYRYCHSFSDDEVDRLVASVRDRADVLARFDADGRTGNLNAYVVLQVR